MAFQSKYLSILAYTKHGFTLWHYTTEDPIDLVAGSEYFDNASDMLRAGDKIEVNYNTDSTPGFAGLHVMRSSIDSVFTHKIY